MAAQLSAGEHFKFKRVQVIKDESLGIGSYGAVYKAKCDKLPCAAKLLHPILFHDRDPGSRRIRERFEQEIHFLSGIRHPHIVQYLGACTDNESGLPVLLMELMDESLTHLLERSQQPLPFHQEVNISHDTALALDYLHSNSIIHRDLSSNNVLITGDRAKVTDFGMSKALEANAGITPFTQCPGTAVYMPPEGLKNPPVYTAKLDCFSFGVLGIQIMTRQFPNPGPKQHIIEDARSPTGTMKVPIPDSERRKKHINLITTTHPLLSLALRCISYRDSDRPSAQELCDQLEALKGGIQYKHSKKQGQGHIAAQVHQAERLHQQRLQDKHAVIAAGRVQEREEQLIEKLRKQDQQLAKMTQYQEEILQLIQEKDHIIEAKDRKIESKERQLQELNQKLQANESVVADCQQVLAQREKEVKRLHKDISVTTREGSVERVLRQHQIASATPTDTIKLNWKTYSKAPSSGMARGSSAVSSDGSTVYFVCGNSVYKYNMRGHQWSKLPPCLHWDASLVVVEGLLTAVGGTTCALTPTSDLFSLTGEMREQPWTKYYPPMPTKRWYPAVVCTANSLIVAGGRSDDTTVAVEVMNTSSQQWFTASSLPHYFNRASATLCGDSLYLTGGFDQPGAYGSLSVLTCSLSALLESCHSQSLPARMRALFRGEQSQVWKKAADAPVYHTSCTTLCGQVIAVGGNRLASSWHDHDSTDNVYQYDPIKNTWTVISHMQIPRFRCLIAALPDNSIVVVGGNDEIGDVVEVGSVE